MNHISTLAVEVWSNSGEPTAERLKSLVEHYSKVYGFTEQYSIDAFYNEAYNRIPVWKWEK